MHTVNSRVHRPTIVGAVLALFFSLVFIAAPAQAATLGLNTTATHIELGQSFTLSWAATETTQVQASGAWSGDKAETDSQVITPTSAGTFTYTLTAFDANGRDVTRDVTVIVDPAALPGVTPAPVTFPDSCTVVVPATAGVIYSVTIDGDTFELDADTYDGAEFFGDSAAVFTAEADDTHVITPGATASWNYTPGEECFEEPVNSELVTVDTSCSAVTFTNIADQAVEVLYGDQDNEDADGDFLLEAGASKKVKTSRSSLDFVAFSEDDELAQFDSVKVPQHCGSDVDDPKPSVKWPAKHPTAAPAAGVTGHGDGPAAPVLVLLGIATLIATRRAYSLGR